jgi:arginine/lysine/histidine transporter system substrate-binding protein
MKGEYKMKKNKHKKVIGILLFITMLITLVGCGSNNNSSSTSGNSESETMKRIKENGKIVLGTSADFPPFEFHKKINGKDQIVGFDIEIAKQIAEDLGVKLEIKDMSFDGLLAALNSGSVDFVISGMQATPERKKNVDFSEVYYQGDQSVIVRKSDINKYKKLSDFANKKFGVQKGSTQQEIMMEQVPKANLVELAKVSDLVLMLKNNKVEGCLTDSPIAKAYADANDDLAVANIKVDVENIGTAIAVKKNSSDLVSKINKSIDKLKKNNTIDKLLVESTKLIN